MMITAAILIVGLLLSLGAAMHTVHELGLEISALKQLCCRRGIARFRRDDGEWELIQDADPMERILRTARRG